ncbi:hypothetical protein MMC21_001093 [Puttea exsequens]|nr:hypothetical protein [Puttea exsequens]
MAAYSKVKPDELIKLHKSMVETNADANSALAKATNGANMALTQLQNDFAVARQAFQEQLDRDLEISTAKTQTLLERLISNMDSALQSATNKFAAAIHQLDSDTAKISENVRRANGNSIDLQKNINQVFQQVAEGGEDLAATQTRQWNENREIATELRGSLQDMSKVEVNALLGVFHGIHNQLVSGAQSEIVEMD